MLLLNNVSLIQLKHDLVANGVPGAEDMTAEFVVFTGNVAVPPGSAITQPANQKLNNEYYYYMTEIRASANFGDEVAGTYVPYPEAQNINFQLAADGRTRPVFRQVMPFGQLIGARGQLQPFILPAAVPFAGAETLICTVATTALWNAAAVAAQVAFTIVLVCGMVKAGALQQVSQAAKK